MHVTGIAIVLLVILILIVGILFSPITYSVELSSRKPYRAALKVQWLGRVFRIHFAYESGKPFFKEVYILRQAKLGATRDYEEWLSRRVQEETADGFSDDIMDEAKSEKDANTTADAKVQQTASKPVEAAKPAERVRFDKDGTPLDVPKRAADEMAAQSERTEEDASKTTEGKQADDGFDKRWFMPHVKNVALYETLLLFIKRCYHHSLPGHVRLEGRFGNGNPFDMGIAAATIYSLWPEGTKEVELDYSNNVCLGSLDVKGRMYPGVFAWYGTLFVLAKPVRSFLMDALKFARHYKKTHKK